MYCIVDKLWTAPEILRIANPPQQGTKMGDVYSFAIIAQQILYQRGVFYQKDNTFSHKGNIIASFSLSLY